MSEDAATTTAEDRATRAAEELGAEGLSVTAASVRERSGVRMATAAAAAKDWKDREKKVEDEPTEPVPEHLQARFLASFESAWREARALARAEFDETRAGWEAKLLAAEGDVAKLTSVVDELEQECERIDAESKTAAQKAAEALSALQTVAAAKADEMVTLLAAERSRADRAEGALGAVTAERDRLLTELGTTRTATGG